MRPGCPRARNCVDDHPLSEHVAKRSEAGHFRAVMGSMSMISSGECSRPLQWRASQREMANVYHLELG